MSQETVSLPEPSVNPRLWLESNIQLVQSVVRRMASSRRLTVHDRDELFSMVCTRLVQDDYRALRRFRGDSRITTYLTVLTRRLLLDLQVAAWGKWRPSARARALGPPAVELERRLVRDEVPLPSVLAALGDRGTSAELESLAIEVQRRPNRRRCRFVTLEGIQATAPLAADPFWVLAERARAARKAGVFRRLRVAVQRLAPADRELVVMRYVDGLRVSEIARRLRTDPKRLYRRLSHLARELKGLLVTLGVTPDEASDCLDGEDVQHHVPYQGARVHGTLATAGSAVPTVDGSYRRSA